MDHDREYNLMIKVLIHSVNSTLYSIDGQIRGIVKSSMLIVIGQHNCTTHIN